MRSLTVVAVVTVMAVSGDSADWSLTAVAVVTVVGGSGDCGE
jgi:hypothetical protein